MLISQILARQAYGRSNASGAPFPRPLVPVAVSDHGHYTNHIKDGLWKGVQK